MAVFEIQTPDGRTFEVEAPNAEAAYEAVSSIPARNPDGASFGQSVWENIVGDDDPNTQNFGERLGSFLNKAGESMTMGLVGDEASAAVESLVPGLDYEGRRDHYRQQEAVLERDNLALALAADIGGALAAPVGGLGAAAKGASILRRATQSGLATGAMSGAYGWMEGEGDERGSEGKDAAMWGGAIGSVVPFLGAGINRAIQGRASNKAIRQAAKAGPSTDDLLIEGAQGYQDVADAGVAINPSAIGRLKSDITSHLRGRGAHYTGAETAMPQSRGILNSVEEIGQGANSVPFDELDMFRRFAGNAAGANLGNRGDTAAATQVVGILDDFVGGLKKADVDAGDIDALKSALPKARETWARMSRSQLLDDAIENAADYRSGEAAGLRAQFQRILKNKKLRRGFSETELAAMRKVVNGTLPEQLLSYAGSGLGMMGQVGIGLASGNPFAALASVGTAAASRKGAEAVVRRNAEMARAAIASGKLQGVPLIESRMPGLFEQIARQGTAAALN
jgi:hypothetical protein